MSGKAVEDRLRFYRSQRNKARQNGYKELARFYTNKIQKLIAKVRK